MARRRAPTEEELNPYIALADLVISIVLVVVLCVALGSLGLADTRYRKDQQQFAEAVNSLPPRHRPLWNRTKNDPPGVQRWVFPGKALFKPPVRTFGAIEQPVLTPEGARALDGFARLLNKHRKWKRIRVEGHTRPPVNALEDDWELSSARAIVVGRKLVKVGRIQPNYLAVAGRAGQNPAVKILVYSSGGDPKAAWVRRWFAKQGVSYSAKDANADGEARREFARRGLRASPVVVLQLMDGTQEYAGGADPKVLRRMVDLFPSNDRVEVLLEYRDRNQRE